MATPEHIQRLRHHVGHELLLTPSVTAFVRRSDDKILVVRPAKETGWTLPGGLVELGESPVDCLTREIQEETGLQVYPVTVMAIMGGKNLCRRTYPNLDQVEYVDILFRCEIVGGDLNPLDAEIDKVDFRLSAEIEEWRYPIPLATLRQAESRNGILINHGNDFELIGCKR